MCVYIKKYVLISYIFYILDFAHVIICANGLSILTLYCYHVFCFDKYLSICCYTKCANLKLNENEYDANFNTSKVYNTWI